MASTNLMTATKVRGEFFRKLDSSPYTAFMESLSLSVDASGAQINRYAFLPDSPKPQRLDGTGALKVAYPFATKFEIENLEFANAVAFRRFFLANDQSGDGNRKISDLANAWNYFQWDLVRTLIANGGTGTGYDGDTFFGTAHAYGGATAQKNTLTSSEVSSLAVTGSGTPTPEEFVTAVVDTIGYMQGWLDVEGRPMNLAARRFALIVPKELIGVGLTAIRANNLAGGEVNVLNAAGFMIDLIPAPDISGGTVFYVARIDDENRKPFVFQTHTPLDVTVLDESSEHFKKKQEILASCYWAGNAGYGEPGYIAKATLS